MALKRIAAAALVPLLAAALIFAYAHVAGLSRLLDFSVKQPRTATLPLPSLGAGIYILYAALASSVCLSLYEYLKMRGLESEKLRTQAEEALEMIAAYSRSGATLLDAVKRTAEAVEEPMRSLLEAFAEGMTLGEDPEKLAELLGREKPPEVKWLLRSVAIASKSGGRQNRVLEQAWRALAQLRTLEEARRTRLAEYRLLTLATPIAYALASAISLTLVEPLRRAAIPIAPVTTDVEILKTALFITAQILSAFSALITARTINGKTKNALRYYTILAATTTAILLLIH